MGWPEEVELGEVFASISGATRWKDWKDDKIDVSSVLPIALCQGITPILGK